MGNKNNWKIITSGKKIFTAPNLANGDVVKTEGPTDVHCLMPTFFAKNTLCRTVIDVCFDLIGIVIFRGSMTDIKN